MMKWHLDQIINLSALSKRFGGVEDEDMLLLLERLKLLDESYAYIEKCSDTIYESMKSFQSSISTISAELESLEEKHLSSENAKQLRARMEYMNGEYGRWIVMKVKTQGEELIAEEIRERRRSITELKDRILLCEKSCAAFSDMQARLTSMISKKDTEYVSDVELSKLKEDYEKLRIVVDQQKLQLQSDVRFIIEKEAPFVERCFSTIESMEEMSVMHTYSLVAKEPPKYLIDKSAPFVEGKEDSEIDFTVTPGGKHILPLSVKKGRELLWCINTGGNDIAIRILFRNEAMRETIVESLHHVSGQSSIIGSFIGEETGMLELLFDNSSAFFRSKPIHIRLGTIDAVSGEECHISQKEQKVQTESSDTVLASDKMDSIVEELSVC